MKKIIIALFLFPAIAFAQRTQWGDYGFIDKNKGFLPPVMTGAQMNAIVSPAFGYTVANSDSLAWCFYDGTGWKKFGSAISGSGANFANTNLTLTGNRAHNGLGLYSIQFANPTLFKVYTLGDSSVFLIQTAGNNLLSWDKYNIIRSYSQRSGKNYQFLTDTTVARMSADEGGVIKTEVALTDNEIVFAIGTDSLIRLKGDSVKFGKLVNNTNLDSLLFLTATGKLKQVAKNSFGSIYPTLSRFNDSLTAHVNRADTTRNGIRADLNGKLGTGLAFLLSDTSSKKWDWWDITGKPTIVSTETDPVYSATAWPGSLSKIVLWDSAYARSTRSSYLNNATGTGDTILIPTNDSVMVAKRIKLNGGTGISITPNITGSVNEYTITNTGSGGSYTGSKSVQLTSADFTLVNDSITLVQDRVYAYSSSDATRGWKKTVVTNFSSLANGDYMKYNSSTGQWNNVTPANLKTDLGFTGYTISVQALTSSPTDAQTIYFGTLPKAPVTAAATSKVYVRSAGTITAAELYCYSGTAGTNESWSIYIRVNNTTDYLIQTVSASTSERVFTNNSLSISLSAGDYFEIKSVNPTWATNPLTTIFGGYVKIN